MEATTLAAFTRKWNGTHTWNGKPDASGFFTVNRVFKVKGWTPETKGHDFFIGAQYNETEQWWECLVMLDATTGEYVDLDEVAESACLGGTTKGDMVDGVFGC